jgi:hypothetical protein
MNEILKDEIKDLELDFKNQVEALKGIVCDNPSAVFYDLVYIKYQNNDTKKFVVCKFKATNNFSNFMRLLKDVNVFYKNIVKRENIYLAVTPKTEYLNFIWLDDIKLENISDKQKEYLTLIETSEGNYQAWIQLDKVYKENKVQEVKKYLVEQLKADKAATAKIQPMRLPGFYSYKHEIPFYVKVVNQAIEKLNVDVMLKKIQKSTLTSISRTQQAIPKPKNNSDIWKQYSYYKTQLFYNYEDRFFDPLDERDMIIKFVKDDTDNKVDENVIDINYIYQLVIRDYKKNEIFNYLDKSRPDLTIKHKNTDDYFERTYLKALLFYKKFYPELKLYENDQINEILQNKPANKNVIEFLKEQIKGVENEK